MASSYWVQARREQERRRREAERAARALQREQLRREREQARQRAAAEKERKQLHLESRLADTEQANRELARYVETLEGLLAQTLAVDDAIDFESLKDKPAQLRFEPGALAQPGDPPELVPPAPLSALQKLVPGAKAKHAAATAAAEQEHAEAMSAYEQTERDRETRLAAARAAHDERARVEAERITTQHAQVDAFRTSYERGEPEAVVNYSSMVLAASRYPDGFPQQHKVAFVPESRQLVVELDLPTFEGRPRRARVPLRQSQRRDHPEGTADRSAQGALRAGRLPDGPANGA